MQATVTSKGQITLPKGLRDKLSLSTGDRVEFIFEDDQTVKLVVKHVPIRKLKGMLPKPPEPVSLEDMEKAIKAGSRNV